VAGDIVAHRRDTTAPVTTASFPIGLDPIVGLCARSDQITVDGTSGGSDGPDRESGAVG
jgi:hypothetical protein